MKPALTIAILVFALLGCRDQTSFTEIESSPLVAMPSELHLGAPYVGQSVSGVVTVTNRGRLAQRVDVSISEPFAADTGQLQLAAAESATITVSLTARNAGLAAAVLHVGTIDISVDATVLEVPACMATTVCAEAAFDTANAECREVSKPDGTSCQTQCLSGACSSGTCVGELINCDDHDACTIDTCDEAGGCNHPASTCPPSTGPCQVAGCDPTMGCRLDNVPDGTLCGVDNCLHTQVDVCITGQCVQRVRPASGRCANRWVPALLPARGGHSMVYDRHRQRVVLFGGRGRDFYADTWEWDGATWTMRTPAAAPPAREAHSMTYDTRRQRVVLFGGVGAGYNLLDDTWEWDGTTWVQRTTPSPPAARSGHSLTYDEARQRVVLFGGRDGTGLLPGETWEWDGNAWTLYSPPSSPSARTFSGLAYDAARRRVVLFGGYDTTRYLTTSDTWEWDGTEWTQRFPATSPPSRSGFAMAYDEVRQRIVLQGGWPDWAARSPVADVWAWDGTTWVQEENAPMQSARFGGQDGWNTHLDDTWDWDGSVWHERRFAMAPSARAGHAMTYDSVRQNVVLFGGGNPNALAEPWTLNALQWTPLASPVLPTGRTRHAMAFDTVHHHAILFGGLEGTAFLNDTWQWDGTTWTQRILAAAPSPRGTHALAWDSQRQKIVLFGGFENSSYLADTWEWDGRRWLEQTPSTAPVPRGGHALAYDSDRQVVVLFGGRISSTSYLADTWEWDGTSWLMRAPVSSPPASYGATMAYDEARHRMTLFNGEAWLFLP